MANLTGEEILYSYNGTSPVTSSQVYGAFNAALDIMNTTATIAVPTSPTVSILPTINQIQNIGYNPATGEITFLYTQPYTIIVMLNCSTAVNRTLYGYGQLNTGSGYSFIQYSGRQKQFNSGNDGQVNFQSANVFQAGWKLQLGNFASGAMNFVTDNVPGTTPGTLVTPAMRALITSG